MIEAMGAGGLGRRTLLQLSIACWYLMKKVGMTQFKKLWKEVANNVGEKYFDDNEFEEERRMFAEAFEQLEDAIAEGLFDGLCKCLRVLFFSFLSTSFRREHTRRALPFFPIFAPFYCFFLDVLNYVWDCFVSITGWRMCGRDGWVCT